MKALLHPPTRKTGIPYNGRYDVSFDGEIIVKGSRDPEPDLARALLAKGITGTIAVHDANTGKHRSTVDIEKAAKVRTEERPHGPRFRKVSTGRSRSTARWRRALGPADATSKR